MKYKQYLVEPYTQSGNLDGRRKDLCKSGYLSRHYKDTKEWANDIKEELMEHQIMLSSKLDRKKIIETGVLPTDINIKKIRAVVNCEFTVSWYLEE